MILIIDNYDSFTYNLVQLTGQTDADIRVVRNDAISVEEVIILDPTHIILSPGPGRPDKAGICEDLIRKMAGRVPILGVCLGHQAICEVYGAVISYAGRLMHGKKSMIYIDNSCPLFYGLPDRIEAARYHSLAAKRETLPKDLIITGLDEAGEIMAVRHRFHQVYGVQFHPESVMTPHGHAILRNFLKGE
ncbi:MAG TPA: aminodeoxychorismate/anthranilate synthase component II [Clostridiaceae bacterium]|nr:aminodeoxychorismate/anthranilate synthase component II [Clostridiaceae bacterium]